MSMDYPSREEVSSAGIEQLGHWWRDLPPPSADSAAQMMNELAILEMIDRRLEQLKKHPGAYARWPYQPHP